MINKTLHQIWLGNKPHPVEWMNTWKDKHPDWEYKLWNEENLPFMLRPELNYSDQSDILRYQLLYEYGGVYVDADSICLEPLDDLLDNEAFCSWENEYVTTGLMLGAFMGTVPHNPFFKAVLDEVEKVKDVNPGWFTVGPGLLTRMVGKLRYQQMTIYPSYYFSPKHHSGLEYKGTGRVYANHYWGSTPKLTSIISKDGFTYEKL